MQCHFWVCGNLDGPDELNPLFLLRDPLAREVVLLLTEAPATEADLAGRLGHGEKRLLELLNALERSAVIAEDQGLFRLAFSFFTDADEREVLRVSTEIGSEIRDRLSARAPYLAKTIASLPSARYMEPEYLSYALVGCFGLNWCGLRRLEKLGYVAPNKSQPAGNYLLHGIEQRGHRQTLLRSSHNVTVEGFTFTTFGDNAGRRNALPDLLWDAEQCLSKDPVLSKYDEFSAAVQCYHTDILADLARLMHAAASVKAAGVGIHRAEERTAELTSLLAHLGYMSQDRQLLVPVCLASDRAVIEVVVDIVLEEIQSIMQARYGDIRRRLAGITPERCDIPFGETIDDVWHSIFAEANRLLIEDGLMSVPMRNEPGAARYMAWLTCPGADPRYPTV